MKHKKAVAAGVLMLGIGTVALALAGTGTAKSRSGLRRPHLDYLKAVNLAAPPEDPQLLFLLMGEYANANRPYEGAGGHGYFRSLDPAPRFYARSNYQEELRRELDAAGTFAKAFFGARFNLDEVRSFKPDVTITQATGVNVGGTRIELIPVEGGEMPDALFINVPDLGVLFVGDFIMPYLGAPFVEEGNLQGLLDAIDIVVEKQPRHILHGHEPLTRNFGPAPVLAALKADLEGISHISHAERAEMLVDYLGVSESQLARALQRLITDGKYELAASLLESSGGRFAHSESVAKLERLIYRKLMEQNQNTDPFKFLLFSAKAGEQLPQMAAV